MEHTSSLANLMYLLLFLSDKHRFQFLKKVVQTFISQVTILLSMFWRAKEHTKLEKQLDNVQKVMIYRIETQI